MVSFSKYNRLVLFILVGISCHNAQRLTCPLPVQARGANLLAKAPLISVIAKFPEPGQPELAAEVIENVEAISVGRPDGESDNATSASWDTLEDVAWWAKPPEDDHINQSVPADSQLEEAGKDSANSSAPFAEDDRHLVPEILGMLKRDRHGKGANKVNAGTKDKGTDAKGRASIRNRNLAPWARAEGFRRKANDETNAEKGAGAILTPELLSWCFWFVMCVGALMLFCWELEEEEKVVWSEDGQEAIDADSGLHVAIDEDAVSNFDEDIYGVAVGLLIKDTHAVSIGNSLGSLQWTRIMSNVVLLYFTMALQMFIMVQVERFVVPGAIGNVRYAYSNFEWEMYGRNQDNGKLVEDNLWLGKTGFFNATLFDNLDQQLKEDVCHIPFSQPLFCLACLLMWTLTCSGEIRKTVELFEMFVFIAPTVTLLSCGVRERKTKDDPLEPGLYGYPLVVHSLTRKLKAVISIFILLPRVIIGGRLIWIGCRWLSATTDFGDLIMNAMALEFILLLKDLLYAAVVANRTKRDLQYIQIQIYPAKERPSYAAFFTSLMWGVSSIVWAAVYIFYLQQVLPGYNWDVRQVCTRWLTMQG